MKTLNLVLAAILISVCVFGQEMVEVDKKKFNDFTITHSYFIGSDHLIYDTYQICFIDSKVKEYEKIEYLNFFGIDEIQKFTNDLGRMQIEFGNGNYSSKIETDKYFLELCGDSYTYLISNGTGEHNGMIRMSWKDISNFILLLYDLYLD